MSVYAEFYEEFQRKSFDPITGLPIEVKDLDPRDFKHPTVRAQARIHLEKCLRLK